MCFEDGYIGCEFDDSGVSCVVLLVCFVGLLVLMFVIGFDDDVFGMVDVIEWLVGYYMGSNVMYLWIVLVDIGVDVIGYFVFFYSCFIDMLWFVVLYWL